MKTELIDAYIQTSEMLQPMSCPVHDLVLELKRDGFGYSRLDKEAVKAYLDYRKNGYQDKTMELLENYETVEMKRIFAKFFYNLMMDKKEHSSEWLYKYSNDFRSYDRWLKAFDKTMKNYADHSPLNMQFIDGHYYFDSHVLNLATMGMTGELWTYWRIVRTKILTEIYEETGRCALTEVFGEGGILDQQRKEQEQAEKEWRDV